MTNYEGTDKTMFEMIEKDVLSYKFADSGVYDEALLFYVNTESTDEHPEVIKIIKRIGSQDVNAIQAQHRALPRAEALIDLTDE